MRVLSRFPFGGQGNSALSWFIRQLLPPAKISVTKREELDILRASARLSELGEFKEQKAEPDELDYAEFSETQRISWSSMF